MRKIGLFLVFHFVRSVWAKYIFRTIYLIIYIIKVMRKPVRYKANKELWDNIKSVSSLVGFFQTKYRYKWDGKLGSWRGFIDHDNPSVEFFSTFGDCNDMGSYAKKKLKKLNYDFVYRIYLIGDSLKTSHCDCLFYESLEWYLFNYGKFARGKTIEECIKNLNYKWNNYFGENIIWFITYPILEWLGGGLTLLGILTGLIFLIRFIFLG